MSIIMFLFIGLIAGWLAGLFVRGGGFGLLGDLVVGIVGAVIGGYVFAILGISAGGFLGTVAMSTMGAVVLLMAVHAIKRK